MSKTEIRKEIEDERRDLSPEWIVDASCEIQQRIVSMSAYEKADVVGCYLPIHGEVRTSDVIADSWERGKVVCVPVYDKEHDRYLFSRLTSSMKVISGRFKVPEPETRDCVEVQEINVMIVPGLAFDLRGGRVGHGGGYYDRILEKGIGGVTVAAAFEFQIRDEVPTTSKDVRMDFLVTEKRIIPAEIAHGL